MARKTKRVEVVETELGLELQVDGTFASLYREGEVTTGCVWDAIAAPLLVLPPKRRRRILLLGLGAGSVARLARALAPDALIVGIELDAEVVRQAEAHFDLAALDVEIHIEDALGYLGRETREFDAILEDVFIGVGDGVHKPGWLPEPGHSLAEARLAKGGVLVTNTLDEAPEISKSLQQRFSSVVAIGVEDYDNRILVGSNGSFTGRGLRRKLAADSILRSTLPVLAFRTLS